MSPERSSSPQEDEATATPKMSVPASPVAGTPVRDAESPISLLLAVAQSRHGDDDLTSLAWLHERDLLKGMNINPSPSNSINSTPIKSTSILSDQFPTSDYVDDSSISAPESCSSSLNSPIPPNPSNQGLKHPHNIPYDPLIHTNNKPPYSFSCLIFMAIEDSIQKALPVKEIYAWILDHFPYFKNAPTGWKNSVRHNLSLNKCFQKVEKAPVIDIVVFIDKDGSFCSSVLKRHDALRLVTSCINAPWFLVQLSENLGKGSLWTVDQQYKPNLIQALTRSPFHPCSTLDPSTYFNSHTKSVEKSGVGGASRLPNPELYPYLSRKLAATEFNIHKQMIKSEPMSDSESLDAADAAAVMLSLKNGPKYRQKRGPVCQIITTSPSQDHTYSAANSTDSHGNTDEAFESDDDRMYKRRRTSRKIDFEDEEERKIKEGAETLLNLAGYGSRRRGSSQSAEYDPYKRIKLSPRFDINENEAEERPAPFKPRLLRPKKGKAKAVSNNNNDEWVKHRRELEINRHR